MQNSVAINFTKHYEKYSSKINIPKRAKFCDFFYIRLLSDVIKNLSSVYNVKWSNKAWEIFIGPYLHRYVSVVYDRYHFLKFLKKKKIVKQKFLHHFELLSIKREDFIENIEKTSWNINLLSLLKTRLNNKELKFNNFKFSNGIKINNKCETRLISLSRLFHFIFKNNEKVLVYKPYWGDKWEVLKLYFKLNIFPWIYNFSFASSNKNVVSNIRTEKFRTTYKDLDKFEKILRDIFFYILPKFYLEHINELKEKSNNLIISKKIKKIYSSLCLWEDTVFKFWLSDNYYKGIKIFYSQHGAVYGMTLYSYSQYLETKLVNYYLTWGWKKKKSLKIIPFYTIKKIYKKSNVNYKKKFLIINSKCFNFLVENHTGIYFGHKSFQYINKVLNLLNMIPQENRKYFDIRNYPYEDKFSPYNLKLLTKKYQNFTFLSEKKNINNIIRNYKIIINTYLSTTFLECLSSNIPSLLVLDISSANLNSESKNFLFTLEKCKIIQRNNEKLLNFINDPELNIENWWNDKKLQNILKTFCNNHSRISDSLSKSLSQKIL